MELLGFFDELISPLVLVACLCLGYVIKKWIPTDNKYIPTILAVVGAVMGCFAMQTVSLEAIVGGAVSGVASTGMHQLFKQYIENKR